MNPMVPPTPTPAAADNVGKMVTNETTNMLFMPVSTPVHHSSSTSPTPTLLTTSHPIATQQPYNLGQPPVCNTTLDVDSQACTASAGTPAKPTRSADSYKDDKETIEREEETRQDEPDNDTTRQDEMTKQDETGATGDDKMKG
ncbi:hypothetical protein PAXINDRAFT_7986 [Paxillus involutus ATCC 200175]|nr:hypothetical protein PAXINDRAFT_7986 [Paxillus involutus ATCC 200175]